MDKDILEYSWAVINNWAGYSTGGLIIAVVFFWHAWRDQKMKRGLLIGLMLCFFAMAGFKAWRDERTKVLAHLPRVETQIKKCLAAPPNGDPNSTEIVFLIEMINSGEPTGIFQWTLVAMFPNGPMREYYAPRFISKVHLQGETMHLDLNDSNCIPNIYFNHVLEKGQGAEGWVAFEMRGIPDKMFPTGTKLDLVHQDMYGNKMTNHWVWELGSISVAP